MFVWVLREGQLTMGCLCYAIELDKTDIPS